MVWLSDEKSVFGKPATRLVSGNEPISCIRAGGREREGKSGRGSRTVAGGGSSGKKVKTSGRKKIVKWRQSVCKRRGKGKSWAKGR